MSLSFYSYFRTKPRVLLKKRLSAAKNTNVPLTLIVAKRPKVPLHPQPIPELSTSVIIVAATNAESARWGSKERLRERNEYIQPMTVTVHSAAK
jgi:hypothetical protein